MIAAAAAGEETKEVGELGHGARTYALLAGLNAVDRGPRAKEAIARDAITPTDAEPVVDVYQWFRYAYLKVPNLTEHNFKLRQNVSVNNWESIFPVLPLRASK